MANIMSQMNNIPRDGFVVEKLLLQRTPSRLLLSIPGDKIKGRVQHFTRTMPVQYCLPTLVYVSIMIGSSFLLTCCGISLIRYSNDNNQHATVHSQVLTNQHPYPTNQLQLY